MRGIKFRGKALMSIEDLDQKGFDHNNGWVYGSLIVQGGSYYIVGGVECIVDDCLHHNWWLKVRPATVGQYIGYKDISGREIYSRMDVKLWDEEPYTGDSITTEYDWEMTGVIVYDYGSFWVQVDHERNILIPICAYVNSDMSLRIIGNAHEYPELLSDTK